MIGIDNKELVDDFKDYLRIDKNYSENTIESYIRDITSFLEYTNKEILDISKKDIEVMEINLPSLDIQNKIVSILDSIEEKINNNNLINKKLTA